jgi:hypothetical protein
MEKNQAKFYTNKSNAKRAAIAAGLDADKLELVTNKEGQFRYIQIDEAETPMVAEAIATAQANADKIANNALATKTIGGIPVTRESTVERPTKQVWHIADEMKGAKRKEVLDACVKAGIAYYTARTQYQLWLQCQKEMAERVNKQNGN